jgi:hypothetical protein
MLQSTCMVEPIGMVESTCMGHGPHGIEHTIEASQKTRKRPAKDRNQEPLEWVISTRSESGLNPRTDAKLS